MCWSNRNCGNRLQQVDQLTQHTSYSQLHGHYSGRRNSKIQTVFTAQRAAKSVIGSGVFTHTILLKVVFAGVCCLCDCCVHTLNRFSSYIVGLAMLSAGLHLFIRAKKLPLCISIVSYEANQFASSHMRQTSLLHFDKFVKRPKMSTSVLLRLILGQM